MKQNPSVLLLLVAYLFVLPFSLSYQNAWVEPEQLKIKSFIMADGLDLNVNDLKNGLSWQIFEYKPRCTRPFSSYFEILDTKFRSWLWHFILPHPSLSLTWIFSLILAPLCLYRLLKNLGISANTSMALTAFYLSTPGTLSFEAMLFRPAKPMTNFLIIFCLYLASRFKKNYLDKNLAVPLISFLGLAGITFLAFFWDETALLIIPAVLIFVPALCQRKAYLGLWLFLPLAAVGLYATLLPWLAQQAGFPRPNLLQYDLLQTILQPKTILQSLGHLGQNSCNVIFETMGLEPLSGHAPFWAMGAMAGAGLAWAVILFLIISKGAWRQALAWPCLFLVFLLLLFNAMMSATMSVWGPYYYGSFWVIFFILVLARLLESVPAPRPFLSLLFLLIMAGGLQCFIGINTVYKKYHWYPYSPDSLEDFFQGTRTFYDRREKPVYGADEIKAAIRRYWTQVRNRADIDALTLPRELGWLPAELEPLKAYDRSIPGSLLPGHFRAVFSDGDQILDWLLRRGHVVKYQPENYFINGDLDTTIADDLKNQYPGRWQIILEFLKEAQSKKPYDYLFTKPGLAYAYNDRGNQAFLRGELDEAARHFSKAVELNDLFEDAYFNLGLVHYRLGQWDKSLDDFSRALAVNPRDIQVYYNRAVIYCKMKNADKAWEDVRRIQSLGAPVNAALIQTLNQMSGTPDRP